MARLMRVRRRRRSNDDNPRLFVRRRRRRLGRRRGRNPRGFVAIPRVMRRGRRGRFVRTGRIVRRDNPRVYRRRRRARQRDSNPWVGGFSYRRRGRRVRVPRHWRRGRARNNPGRRRMIPLLDNPIEAVTRAFQEAFSGDTIETVFHTALGFGGTAIGSRLIMKKVIPALGASPIGRIATTAGVGILGSAVLGMLTKSPKLGARALAGGLLATFWQILSEALPAEAKEFIPTLGEAPESEDFRRAIESEVLKELRGGGGGGATEEGVSMYLQPAGVQETYLTPAGTEAYLTQQEAEGAAMGAYLTRHEAVTAGVGDTDTEFGGSTLPERF